MPTTQRQRRSPSKLTSADWNAKHQPNTPCQFWSGAREGNGVPGAIWSEAFDFGGHTPSVVVKDRGGRVRVIALTHVEVATP